MNAKLTDILGCPAGGDHIFNEHGICRECGEDDPLVSKVVTSDGETYMPDDGGKWVNERGDIWWMTYRRMINVLTSIGSGFTVHRYDGETL